MLTSVEWQQLHVFRTEKAHLVNLTDLKTTEHNEHLVLVDYLTKRITELEKKLNEPI